MTDQTRTALVTAGEQRLGAAAAKAVADDGMTVAVAHLGAGERAKAFADETGMPVFEWDLSDYDACIEGMKDVEKAIGPLDILVNNAGVNKEVMFHKMDRDDWDAVIGVDPGSMFNVTRHVIGGMRERGFGRITNISSVNAARGQAGQTNYCAAKAGVEGFTRALARESAAKGITVNAIAPGYADTAMGDALPVDAVPVDAVPKEMIEKILDMVLISRLADHDEIGRCIRFLASDDAGFITGATFPVNGGMRMG